MSPSRESPVCVLYPDGSAVRFHRQPDGRWQGIDPEGRAVIERSALTDAIESLGRTSGVRQLTEPEEVRELDPPLVWHEDEDGERYLEHQEPYA